MAKCNHLTPLPLKDVYGVLFPCYLLPKKHRNQLPGDICLWSDLLFIEFDVKPYTLTRSSFHLCGCLCVCNHTCFVFISNSNVSKWAFDFGSIPVLVAQSYVWSVVTVLAEWNDRIVTKHQTVWLHWSLECGKVEHVLWKFRSHHIL